MKCWLITSLLLDYYCTAESVAPAMRYFDYTQNTDARDVAASLRGYVY
jgi:hypothetical protein